MRGRDWERTIPARRLNPEINSMNRKVVTAIFALSAVLAISALAQAQSSTGQQAGLTNPGFEEPRVEQGTFVLVETIPGWKTTDTHFEIWGTGFKEVPAHEGTQFAELNAYIDGTLYQDSTGIEPGAVLEFTFAHRGRSGDDTMMLSIGDLGADNALGGGDDTILFAKEYTTGKDAWAVYDSTTEPTIKALGNTVMFAYSAISTATGELGEGNLLDAANFGVGVVSEAPPENAMKLDVEGGAFAFGYRTTAEPGFTEFPNTDSPHPGITRRNRADGEYFSYAQNTRETEVIAQESSLVHYPAKAEGSGVLCPGQNQGDVAIARFTAMNDGEYHFKITAELIEEDPTGAGVTIYVDSQAVEETQLHEHLVPWTTSSVVKLKKGQTVDIAVDSGVDKNWEKDHVLITAKAWTTSPSIATVTMVTAGDSETNEADAAEHMITKDLENQKGAVWTAQKIDFQENFRISAEIYLGTKDDGADGLALVFQAEGNHIVSDGGGLGYQGISPSIVVEFDTYQNRDEYNDPVEDHVGLRTDGDPMHIPSDSVEVGNLEDGEYHPITFEWNASQQTFNLSLDGKQIFNEKSIPETGLADQQVYFGFTAATGLYSNLHKVRSISKVVVIKNE